MLKPTVWELLEGVATSLRETVLPELPPGPARLQLQAAIGITRRVAAALPTLAENLQAQANLIAEALPAIQAAAGATSAPAPAPGDGPLLATASLADAYHQATAAHQALADVVVALPARPVDPAGAGAARLLAALLDRLRQLEADQGLSPW